MEQAILCLFVLAVIANIIAQGKFDYENKKVV